MPTIHGVDLPKDFFNLLVRQKAIDYVLHMHDHFGVAVNQELRSKLNDLFPQEHDLGFHEHLLAIIRVHNSDYFATSAQIESSEICKEIVKMAQKQGIVLAEDILSVDSRLLNLASVFNAQMKEIQDPQYDF